MSKRCLKCMEVYGDEFEICPYCGQIENADAEEAIHMQPGTLLHNRYIVGMAIGYGGFGVTYIGWDGKLEQKVAIKEYLPGEFSTRMPGQSQITVFNGDKKEQFTDGMSKFVEEARRLAKFQNEPGIVKVFDSFEENETAYIVMEFLDGETLTSYLKRERTIPEDEAVAMLMPVMQSLQIVHEKGIMHRDIAPDNIFLTKDGDVKLIDFGASRYATTSHSRSLTVIIKPGYSPEEQYRSRGDQGPHTDVYALAATLYKMITGKTPPDAMERRAKYENQNKDILEEPHKLNKHISLNREIAILNAMNVRIEDRTPNVETFINELQADPPAKRIQGKIKKIDIYAWPLWLKILVPTLMAVVLTFGTLLATGVIKFESLFSETIVIPENVVVVPDVEGMDKDEAIELLQKNNLTPTTEGNIASEYVEVGKIVLQSPPEGTYLEKQGEVALTVSSGKGVVEVVNGVSTVPYVVWDTQEDAISKLNLAGLAEPIIETKSDNTVAAGKVISQSVEAGKEVAEGTQITIVVSTGPEAFSMPNVVDKAKADAEKTLTTKGLVVSFTYEKSDSVAEGNVIRQSITEGADVHKGDEVVLTISSGKTIVTVANVVGKTKNNATSTLEKQGFKVTVVENYSETVATGKVISQSPEGGSNQIKGSTITLYVSKGKQPITVGNVVNADRTLAVPLLKAQGFEVSVREAYSDSVASGKVISQSPKSGSIAYAGDTISLVVSKGKETIHISSLGIIGVPSSMDIGNTATLGYSYMPTNANSTSVTWSSSNTSVATISSSGVVKAIAPGTSTITVKADGSGVTATCTIRVNTPTITGLSNTTVYVGGWRDVTASTTPTSQQITWKTSNVSVASFNGLSTTTSKGTVSIKGENPGTATITASITVGGTKVSKTFVVTVPTPTVTLSSYSGSGTMEAHKYTICNSGNTYFAAYKVSLPTVTTSNTGMGGVYIHQWSVISGEAFISNGMLYIEQPGTIKVKYSIDGTWSATYTYTLTIKKTTSAKNWFKKSPSDSSEKLPLEYIPANTTVTMTEIYSNGKLGTSGSSVWGKVTYGGYTGWIIISRWE